MKTVALKTIAILGLLLSVHAASAQSDLFADNSEPVPSAIAAMFKSEDKITISEFLLSPEYKSNETRVNIRCTTPQVVQVKVFNMDGNLTQQSAYQLDKGISELSLDMSALSSGTYMVQFYSKEGSAVRRLVK